MAFDPFLSQKDVLKRNLLKIYLDQKTKKHIHRQVINEIHNQIYQKTTENLSKQPILLKSHIFGKIFLKKSLKHKRIKIRQIRNYIKNPNQQPTINLNVSQNVEKINRISYTLKLYGNLITIRAQDEY